MALVWDAAAVEKTTVDSDFLAVSVFTYEECKVVVCLLLRVILLVVVLLPVVVWLRWDVVVSPRYENGTSFFFFR
jgi:hypothetical protein